MCMPVIPALAKWRRLDQGSKPSLATCTFQAIQGHEIIVSKKRRKKERRRVTKEERKSIQRRKRREGGEEEGQEDHHKTTWNIYLLG